MTNHTVTCSSVNLVGLPVFALLIICANTLAHPHPQQPQSTKRWCSFLFMHAFVCFISRCLFIFKITYYSNNVCIELTQTIEALTHLSIFYKHTHITHCMYTCTHKFIQMFQLFDTTRTHASLSWCMYLTQKKLRENMQYKYTANGGTRYCEQ